MNTSCETSDLLVFSHLRWDSNFTRPRHLLGRYAKHRRVFYFEGPVFGVTDVPRLHLRETAENVLVVVPYIPSTLHGMEIEGALKDLVDELIYEEELTQYTLLYYNPAALAFTRHLQAQAVIFDKMDHRQSNVQNAIEAELMRKSDVVFTNGFSLFEYLKHNHDNIHPIPSCVDFKHFSQGRLDLMEPMDQIHIPHPRVGYHGIIDERINFTLLSEMADLKPDYQFVMIGPVMNIDGEKLPQRKNIHFLGKKDYHSLPLYLAGWDCAIVPFLLNEETQLLNPTKTAEFLASGTPVVASAIKDIVSSYAQEDLVVIAHTAEEFINSIEMAISQNSNQEAWIKRVDAYLSKNSWDQTFLKMAKMEKAIPKKRTFMQPRIHHITQIHIAASGMI